MSGNTKRRIGADYLYIFAAFSVVLMHTTGMTNSIQNFYDIRWYISNTTTACGMWAVSAFVLLSGINFLNPAKEITYKYVIRKAAFVWLTYFVWGTAYGLVNMLFGSGFSAAGVLEILKKLVFDDAQYHLWFVYMLPILYLLTPLLRKIMIGRTKRQVIAIILTAYVLMDMLPFFMKLPLPRVVFYFPIFLTGYYIAAFKRSRREENTLITIGAICLILSAVLNDDLLGTRLSFVASNAPQHAFVALGMYILFSRLFDAGRERKGIMLIRSCSLGIYLIHDIFITVTKMLCLQLAYRYSLLFVLPAAIVIFALSFAVIYVMRKMKIFTYIC